MSRPILSSRPRWLAPVGGWLLGAAAATGVGILAVSAIGSGIAGTGTEPLTLDQVKQRLTAEPVPPNPTAPSSSGPAGTTGAPSTGTSKVIGSKGGTVVARCVDGRAELLSWSPSQGYEIDDLRRGPDTSAGIQFESDNLEVNVQITCVSGVPTGRVTTKRD